MLRPFILFLVFLFPLPVFAQQTSSNSSSCPCTLRGIVIDSVSSQPIHGVLVSVNGGSASPMLTDSEGKFQFDGLPSGTINLQATKPGYSAQEMIPGGLPAAIDVELAPDVQPATLKLTPEGVIFGKVIDESGEPLEGFAVSLSYRSPMGAQFFQEQRSPAVTDDEGNFRIADLPRGSCYLIVRETQAPALTTQKNSVAPQGFAPAIYPGVSDLSAAVPIKVVPGKSVQANLSLKREPFVRISGTVTGYSPQQQIQLSLESSSREPFPAEISFDPLTGAFQSKWIPPGSYTVNAQASPTQDSSSIPTISTASQPINSTSDLSGIHLTLVPSVNIPIEFRGDISGSPPANAALPLAVGLFPSDHNFGRAYRYSTLVRREPNSSESPALILQNVLPGSYTVQLVSTGSYYVESATWGSADLLHDDLVVSSSASVPPIELTVREGGASITGSVTSGGQRASALVFLLTSAKHPKFFSTDSGGTFTISALAPGTYRIIAVDDPASIDFENPDTLAKFSSYIQKVTVVVRQSASVRLELARLGD